MWIDVAAAVVPDGGGDGVLGSGDVYDGDDDDVVDDDGNSLYFQVLPSLQYHSPPQQSCQQDAFGAGASPIATGGKVPPCSGDGEWHGSLQILEVDSDDAGPELESTALLRQCQEMQQCDAYSDFH